jgi:hypothetical protein
MKKVVLAVVLMTSPVFAQTPNLAPAPPVDRVGDPVKCMPIGKTAKGDLVSCFQPYAIGEGGHRAT